MKIITLIFLFFIFSCNTSENLLSPCSSDEINSECAGDCGDIISDNEELCLLNNAVCLSIANYSYCEDANTGIWNSNFLNESSCNASGHIWKITDDFALNYTTTEDIAGFEFQHNGCVESASGGDSQAYGLSINTSDETILVFSPTGSIIEEGEGERTLLVLSGDVTIDCLSDFIFTSLSSVHLPSAFIEDYSDYEDPCGGCSGYVYLWGECYNIESTNYLDLSYQNLTGLIPSGIGKLVNLENLYLQNNNLTGSIPSEMENLENLIWLNLSSNNLSGNIPSEIGNIPPLERLYLNDNTLSGEIPLEILELEDLAILSLQNNNLSGSIPESICETLNHTDLFIDNNSFCSIYPECLLDYVDTQDCED